MKKATPCIAVITVYTSSFNRYVKKHTKSGELTEDNFIHVKDRDTVGNNAYTEIVKERNWYNIPDVGIILDKIRQIIYKTERL